VTATLLAVQKSILEDHSPTSFAGYAVASEVATSVASAGQYFSIDDGNATYLLVENAVGTSAAQASANSLLFPTGPLAPWLP